MILILFYLPLLRLSVVARGWLKGGQEPECVHEYELIMITESVWQENRRAGLFLRAGFRIAE